MRVGVIGLGVMGRPMALNLLSAGHHVRAFARNREALEPVLANGGDAYESPAAVAACCDAIVTSVTRTEDVEEVLFGRCGVSDGVRPGAMVIDMSTVDPAATRRWAARLRASGVDMLDAPVSGGPERAHAGTLTIMVGGTPEAYARALPLLQCLGTHIRHLGGHGCGQATKLCNQIAQVVAVQGVAEALTLASKLGLDVAAVRETLMTGLAASCALERFGQRMVTRDFAPGIETRLYHKDLALALESAQALGSPLPAASIALQHLTALMNDGGGRLDLSALITTVEDR